MVVVPQTCPVEWWRMHLITVQLSDSESVRFNAWHVLVGLHWLLLLLNPDMLRWAIHVALLWDRLVHHHIITVQCAQSFTSSQRLRTWFIPEDKSFELFRVWLLEHCADSHLIMTHPSLQTLRCFNCVGPPVVLSELLVFQSVLMIPFLYLRHFGHVKIPLHSFCCLGPLDSGIHLH